MLYFHFVHKMDVNIALPAQCQGLKAKWEAGNTYLMSLGSRC